MQPVRLRGTGPRRGDGRRRGPGRPDPARRPSRSCQRAPGWYRRPWCWRSSPRSASRPSAGPCGSSRAPPRARGPLRCLRARPSPAQVQSGANADTLDDRGRRPAAAASRAVARGRRAWLATVDPRDAALVQRQGDLFDRLSALRPTSWSTRCRPPMPCCRPRASARWAPRRSSPTCGWRTGSRRASARSSGTSTSPSSARDGALARRRRPGRPAAAGPLGSRPDHRRPRSPERRRAGRGATVPRREPRPRRTRPHAGSTASGGPAGPGGSSSWCPARSRRWPPCSDRTGTDGLSQLAAVTTGELRTGARPGAARRGTGWSSTRSPSGACRPSGAAWSSPTNSPTSPRGRPTSPPRRSGWTRASPTTSPT